MISNYFYNSHYKFLLLPFLILLVGYTKGQSNSSEIKHDSIASVVNKGRLLQRDYFLKKKLMCRVIYATDNKEIFNLAGYAAIRDYDSCYIFYKNYTQNVYLYNELIILHDQFNAVSPIYKHKKINRKTNCIIEEGNYYLKRHPLEESHFDFEPKYKIGKWKILENNRTNEIDYDKCLLNSKPITFNSNCSRLNNMKQKCDSLILKAFGKSFYDKYIVFNLDKSTYSTKYFPKSPYHSTYNKLLADCEEPIEFSDLCYDIKINDSLRFNTISIRIDKSMNFVIDKQYDLFSYEYKNPCIGIDTSLKNGFNKQVLDFKKVAKSKGINVNSRYFGIDLKWEHKQGIYGKLYFEIEEIIPINTSQRMYKIIRIDPSNANIVIVRDDTNTMKNENESAITE